MLRDQSKSSSRTPKDYTELGRGTSRLHVVHYSALNGGDCLGHLILSRPRWRITRRKYARYGYT